MFRSWKSLFTCMLHVSNNGCVASPFSATLSKSLGTEETHFVCWKVKCFCISCLEKGVQQLRVFPFFFFLSFFLFDVLFSFLMGQMFEVADRSTPLTALVWRLDHVLYLYCSLQQIQLWNIPESVQKILLNNWVSSSWPFTIGYCARCQKFSGFS